MAAVGANVDEKCYWSVIQWSLNQERTTFAKSKITRSEDDVKALFQRGANGPSITKTPGFTICFLPDVEIVRNDAAFYANLNSSFRIPRMFWESIGTNSNGYFRGHEDLTSSPKEKAFSSISRFLLKEVDKEPNRPIDYHWQYLAVASRWQQLENGDISAVLLCFDIHKEQDIDRKPRPIANQIEEAFDDAHRKQKLMSLLFCPLGMYTILTETILYAFDRALWMFRGPVRVFEKERLDLDHLDQDENDPENDLKTVKNRYENMHELSRHIIHMSETLDVTTRIIDKIKDQHGKWCGGLIVDMDTRPHGVHDMQDAQSQSTGIRSQGAPDVQEAETNILPGAATGTGTQPTDVAPSTRDKEEEETRGRINAETGFQEDFLFFALFFEALKLRAQAFEERLHNEIQLAFNWVAALNNKTQRKILAETKDDGKETAKVVAIVSLTFLPASFITGFFGMNVWTFTGTSWNSMSWSLGGILFGIFGSVVIGPVLLFWAPNLVRALAAGFRKGGHAVAAKWATHPRFHRRQTADGESI